MSAYKIALLISLFFGSMCFAGETPFDALKNVKQVLTSSFEKKYPNVTVSVKVENTSGELIVSWDIRKYVVHGRDMIGNWSDSTHLIDGPARKGCTMSFFIQNGAYNEQLHRIEIDGKVSAESAIREPYFFVSCGLVNLKNKNVATNIYFGAGADTEMIQKVYQEVVAAIKSEFGN